MGGERKNFFYFSLFSPPSSQSTFLHFTCKSAVSSSVNRLTYASISTQLDLWREFPTNTTQSAHNNKLVTHLFFVLTSREVASTPAPTPSQKNIFLFATSGRRRERTRFLSAYKLASELRCVTGDAERVKLHVLGRLWTRGRNFFFITGL